MFTALLIAVLPSQEIQIGHQTFATQAACQAEANEFNTRSMADRAAEVGDLLIHTKEAGDVDPFTFSVFYSVRCEAAQ